jgi:D-alanyl-D-alanine carboxypeptidase
VQDRNRRVPWRIMRRFVKRQARPIWQARPQGIDVAPPAPRRRRLRPLLGIGSFLAAAVMVPALLLTPPTPPPVISIAPPPTAVASPTALARATATPRTLAGAAPDAVLATPEPLTPRLEAALFQAALDASLHATEAPGATFAVVRSGELLWTGAGGVAPDGSSLAADSQMVIGSVTKTFVAALILQLVEEGRVNLDATLAEYLPDLALTGADTISLRQLLDHTSGLADVFNEATRIGIEEDPYRPWSATELISVLHEPWYAPGENWAYANTNYLLLTLVAERVTGFSLEQLLTDRFGAPLGLTGSRLLSPTDAAPGHLEPAWTTIFRGSGAMISTAADLARWGDALYTGSVLLDGTRREMLDFNSFEHGLGVQVLTVGGLDGYGHTGLLDTYTTLLWHLPERDTTIALLVSIDDAELGSILTHRSDGAPSLLDLALDREPPRPAGDRDGGR